MKQGIRNQATMDSSVNQSLWQWFKSLRAPGKLGVIEIACLIAGLAAAVLFALARLF